MSLALALLFPLSEASSQLVLEKSDLLVEAGHQVDQLLVLLRQPPQPVLRLWHRARLPLLLHRQISSQKMIDWN